MPRDKGPWAHGRNGAWIITNSGSPTVAVLERRGRRGLEEQLVQLPRHRLDMFDAMTLDALYALAPCPMAHHQWTADLDDDLLSVVLATIRSAGLRDHVPLYVNGVPYVDETVPRRIIQNVIDAACAEQSERDRVASPCQPRPLPIPSRTTTTSSSMSSTTAPTGQPPTPPRPSP